MAFSTVWKLLAEGAAELLWLNSAQCWWHLLTPARWLVLWSRLRDQRSHLNRGRGP